MLFISWTLNKEKKRSHEHWLSCSNIDQLRDLKIRWNGLIYNTSKNHHKYSHSNYFVQTTLHSQQHIRTPPRNPDTSLIFIPKETSDSSEHETSFTTCHALLPHCCYSQRWLCEGDCFPIALQHFMNMGPQYLYWQYTYINWGTKKEKKNKKERRRKKNPMNNFLSWLLYYY